MKWKRGASAGIRASRKLLEREQWAFDILADGGSLKDVMDEMQVGPREAIALLHQVRVKLSDYAIIPESQWNEVISAALALGEPKALDSGNLI